MFEGIDEDTSDDESLSSVNSREEGEGGEESGGASSPEIRKAKSDERRGEGEEGEGGVVVV